MIFLELAAYAINALVEKTIEITEGVRWFLWHMGF